MTVFGTRNVIISGEAGFGVAYDGGFEWGLRYHATLMKTVAEIATPFDDSEPEELDFYMGSTFGFDLIMGQEVIEGLKPYVSLGFTDASTFFYIGDDGVVGNNGDPYASFTGSLGAQYSTGRLEYAGEFYGPRLDLHRPAPDGHQDLSEALLEKRRQMSEGSGAVADRVLV